ncbi:hypothetical protein NXU95_16165 [Phocaeicola vulgatus]|nr:hypothetical protein [Phocaeicola vulgatus]
MMRYIHRELTVDAHSVDPEHIIIPIRDIEGNLHPGSLQQGWSETDSVYIPDHQIVEQCRLMLQQRDNVVYENSNYAMNIAKQLTPLFFISSTTRLQPVRPI